MGSGGSKNQKEQKERRKNEAKIKGSEIRSIDSCLFEVYPSICKIICPTEKGIKKGTGFLIKLYKDNEPLFCLMFNEHIITKELIEKKTNIEVFYYNEKKRIKIALDQNERFINSNIYIDIDWLLLKYYLMIK